MIELSAQDVAEFRELYRRETGRAISEEQARVYAFNLLQLVALVLKRGDRPHGTSTPDPKPAP